MKILITEPTYKHSIALSRYLKDYDSSFEIIGITSYTPRFPKLFCRYYDRLIVSPLENAVQDIPYDLLIPVGNSSVEFASKHQLKKVILPSSSSIKVGINKAQTLEVAKNLGIPIPRTYNLTSMLDIDTISLNFPCVVKGVVEAGKNVVSYPKTFEEVKNAVLNAIKDPSQRGEYPVIQEYVTGVGLGFFAFYQHGVLKRFYMHQRIREFPVSGGASTAAKTIYHQKAFEYGKRLLDHLQWHGPAMVEFKYDPLTDALALMEINPKFWGSTELGLVAGINFGELLVRTIRGENLVPNISSESYKKTTFFWPFEGDLAAILQSRRWGTIREYLSNDYFTNARTNGFLLNIFRLAEFFKRNG